MIGKPGAMDEKLREFGIDDFNIYKPHPESVIVAELRVFKDHMYDGAGPEQLLAGLRCIDFLTRASDLSDTARMLVEAAVDEAEMRVDLMLAKATQDRSKEENRRAAIRQCGALLRSLESLQRNIPIWADRATKSLRTKYDIQHPDECNEEDDEETES